MSLVGTRPPTVDEWDKCAVAASRIDNVILDSSIVLDDILL